MARWCNQHNEVVPDFQGQARMRLPTSSTLVLCVGIFMTLMGTRFVKLNISPSVPVGLYVLRPVPAQLHRGDVVLLDVPVSVRPWHSRWLPLVKPVAALPGDIVCSTDHTLYVNGADFGPVLQTAHGRPLPQLQGCLVVQAGEVFLASPIAHSLDSRYFGPVPIAALTAQATPLVTW